MPEPLPPDLRWRNVFCLYALVAALGVVQVFSLRGTTFLGWIIAFAVTLWAIADCRRAGHPMLHIVQLLFLGTVPFALPVYLIWSRGMRGAGIVLINVIGLFVTYVVFSLTTMLAIYGPEVLYGG